MADSSAHRSCDKWIALAVGSATLALMLATLHEPAITWDEGFTIRREEKVRAWFHLLISPPTGISRGELFREPILSQLWPFAREEPDGHPPCYAILGDLGWLASHTWLAPLEAHRFGPAVLFCFTLSVMFLFLARRFGRLAAAAAVGSWLFMPRVFAHAHLASYDMPLACLWFLVVVAFWKAIEKWHESPRSGVLWSAIFAVLLGLGAATKFTGWLVVLPLLAWSGIAGLGRFSLGRFAIGRMLIRLVLFLPLPLLIGVAEFQLLQKLADTEATIESRAGENSQQRAARTAELFRQQTSMRPLGWALFVNAACWIVLYGIIAWNWSVVFNQADPAKNSVGQSKNSERLNSKSEFGWMQRCRYPVAPVAEVWAAAAALTPAVTIALIPTWWHDPLRGVAVFLWSNLSRRSTTWIPTQFFGTLYEFSLPWYNTLAWVGLTVPPGILILVVVGLVASVLDLKSIVGRKDGGVRGTRTNGGLCSLDSASPHRFITPFPHCASGLALLFIMNGATILVIRAFPGAPGHDGERQLLGSFPFLACIAGVGAGWLRRWLATRSSFALANWTARGLVAIALMWAASAVWHYRPLQLSYYTEFIGGLRGAAKLGMEPTYYWDALDDEVLDWLNDRTRSGEKVLFCNYHYESLRYLAEWGKLRVSIWPHEPGVTKWYVLQNRPGLFAEKPWDRWLAERGQPSYTRKLDGVPLIWIFSFEEYEKAKRETQLDADPDRAG